MDTSNIKLDYDAKNREVELEPRFKAFPTEDFYGNPTLREKLIYGQNGFAPCSEVVELSPNGSPDFGKKILFPFMKTDSEATTMTKMTLRLDLEDPNHEIQKIGDVISMVYLKVNDDCIQRYTGKFLEVLDSIEERHGGFANTNIKIIHLDLPFFPDVKRARSNVREKFFPPSGVTSFSNGEQTNKFLDTASFPLGLIREKQDLKLEILFQDPKTAAKMNYAGLFVELEHPHPETAVWTLNNAKEEYYMNWKEVQFTGSECCGTAQAVRLRINFDGPIETLFWKLYLVDDQGRPHPHDPLLRAPLLQTARLTLNSKEVTPTLPASYFSRVATSKLTGGKCNNDPNTFCWTFIPTSELGKISEVGKEPRGSLTPKSMFCMQMLLNTREIPAGYNIMVDIYAHVWNRMKFKDGKCGLLREVTTIPSNEAKK